MLTFEKATEKDIDPITVLYDAVIDYLVERENFPGWRKGIYPARQTACDGVEDGSLFVLKQGNEVVGAVILNHIPENAYAGVAWRIECEDHEMLVVRTLAIHPDYWYQRLGEKMMDMVKAYAITRHLKAIRLDVCIQNKPAIALYRRCGYQYIDTVDLGLHLPDLKWFELFEQVL